MKIFIYKVLVVAFIFVIVFEITIGNQIKKANQKFDYYLSSEAIENFKIKLKSEITKANKRPTRWRSSKSPTTPIKTNENIARIRKNTSTLLSRTFKKMKSIQKINKASSKDTGWTSVCIGNGETNGNKPKNKNAFTSNLCNLILFTMKEVFDV